MRQKRVLWFLEVGMRACRCRDDRYFFFLVIPCVTVSSGGFIVFRPFRFEGRCTLNFGKAFA